MALVASITTVAEAQVPAEQLIAQHSTRIRARDGAGIMVVKAGAIGDISLRSD